MRKLLIGLLTLSVYFSVGAFPQKFLNTAMAQQKPIPPYAKFGTLAMEKTHEKYPNAKIIDYLHIGRLAGKQTSTEKFKLWLKDNSKEFGVFVNIEFNNETGKVSKITFKETSR
ncbi:DUF3889 domain-containing protein [Bacillus salipaludis]|uniref:DUF3889 domain-containing protein n=1 Tax=Bacillus salipaludis TaxID=2547811 RepID=A0ABW8RBN6_9BACI